MELATLKNVQTMDSREIAELTGKQHAHVCRDISTMFEKLGIDQSNFGSVYKAGNGEDRRCFKLPKRETLILVSGYSVELRTAIIDRWAELELKAMGIPTNYAEALQLAADQAKKIEIMEPKAKFYDQVTGSKDIIDMSTVAKVLDIPGYGRNRIFELLRVYGVLQENNTPYQKYVDSRCFRLIEVAYKAPDGSTRINVKTMVYQKGLDLIRKIIESNKVA